MVIFDTYFLIRFQFKFSILPPHVTKFYQSSPDLISIENSLYIDKVALKKINK